MGSRWLFVAGLGLLACGGAPTAKAPQGAETTESAPAPEGLGERASLATVAAVPADRIWLHVEAPGRDLPLLGSFDLGREDLLAVLQNPRIAARLITGEAAADAVDLERPVDMLVDPERASRGVTLAFSVSDPAKLGKLDLSRIAAGRWEVKRARSGNERYCEVWHAAAGYRLICAHARDNIDSDAAFHLHGAHAGGDRPSLRMEVPGKVWRTLLQRRMAAQSAADGDERRGEEIGKAMMLGFFEEQSSLAFEIRLEPKSVDVVLELGFNDTKSALSQWWTGGANAKISDTFWRIPKSADFAFYKGAADPAALSAAAKPMFDVFQSALVEDEPRPGVAAEAIAVLHELLPPGGALSAAYGRAAGESKSRGWLLLGLDTDSAKYLRDLKKFVALTGLESKKVPGKKERPTESRLRLVGGTAGLPAGTLHLVDESRKNPRYRPAAGEKPEPPRAPTHAFAVPDGGRIWLSFSEDPTQALAGVRAALASTREQSLASVPELAEPAKRPLSGLGKLDVAALVTLSAEDDELAARMKRLAILPYAGKSPIPVWIEISERKGANAKGETVSRLVARLPSEAMADLARVWIK
jgi:hypothetical protein